METGTIALYDTVGVIIPGKNTHRQTM